MGNNEKKRYFIGSLGKGLTVLQILAEAGSPLKLSEIARALGTNNATATRFCYTLSELGFISRNGQKRYHLTPKVLTLGYAIISGLDWREVAKHYLESLFGEVQETVSLSILDGPEIIYMIRIRKREYLPYDIRIGSKVPVHCSSMGKVLMAFGPPKETQRILKALEFRRLTARTITTLNRYLEELDIVRMKGYAIDDEEFSVGISAVAAPVLNIDGYAIAAINIAVPTKEYSRKELEESLVPRTIDVAQQISKALLEMESPLVRRYPL